MLSNEGHSAVMVTVLALAIVTMVAALAFAAWLDRRARRARRKPPIKTPQKPSGNARKVRQRRRK